MRRIKNIINLKESIPIGLNDNFYNWFGKSKIIDSEGFPLICYHGSY